MRYLNSTALASSRTDATISTGGEKKNKITAAFPASPIIIATLGVLAVILFFFSATGLSQAASPSSGFGLEKFVIGAQSNQAGSPAVQAGSHPYALTTTFVLNRTCTSFHGLPDCVLPGDLKDVSLQLPPGFVGDPNATPKCTYQEFVKAEKHEPSCSNDAVVGVATTYFGEEAGNVAPTSNSIYNLVPPAGVAAEFGYIVAETTPILLETSVRTGTDYGLTTSVSDINQAVAVAASKVTIWGVPAEPAHDPIRGSCLFANAGLADLDAETVGYGLRPSEVELEGPVAPKHEGAAGGVLILQPASGTNGCPSSAPRLPLLTNPTSCGVPRTAKFSVDSWEEIGSYLPDGSPNLEDPNWKSSSASLPELSGCESLDFSPTISVEPDSKAGSTPSELNVNLNVPQEGSENPEGTGEADVKDTTVTLPAGMQLSPSAADGLQACSNAQIGYLGPKELNPTTEPGTSTPQFAPKVFDEATKQYEATTCPTASKIANVTITTPLLEGKLKGSVFLAAPQNFQGLPENPFSSLVAMYLVAEEPKAGVLIKLPGHVELGETGVDNGLAPGQIRTTFDNTPQLPFSNLELEFYGEQRAPLATPAYCGTYQTDASLAPWTNEPSVSPLADFDIASGPNGSACTYPGQSLPFNPSLSSGMPNVNAGAFSPLTTTLSREDGQQQIQQVTLHYPPGLSGLLSGVELCGEAQANAGTCGPNSQLGETIVSVGLGGDPFTVTGGKAYITGPYEGAPFGLSIVNPAKAGPFDLQQGRPVVVRAKIEVNPTTAALTVTTNTAAQGHAIPNMIEGIPLQIKHVNVNITRPSFTFNPTSCDPMQVESTITSAEGASSTVKTPFQVSNCQALKFAPQVSFSTSGKTSKSDGADLITKITYPSAAQGTYANVGYVKVELPKALPSRLTTLQKACTSAQFEANPAACPAASKIGYAVVHTPLLPVPLEGPAIFVSHGGEAFPSLTMVLQGYGVKIDLVGATFISKAGITSTTFKTVPDQPFSSFELTLPEGPYSALAANGNLCSQKLVLPNEFVSQAGGAPLKQSSAVTVTGCKPAITVKSHKVKGNTATISVTVPAAGKLVATSKGLSKGSKTSKGATTLTVKLTLTKAETARLKKRRGRKLSAKIHLQFTPTKGARLTTTTTVAIG
jgi:hypothetical protein